MKGAIMCWLICLAVPFAPLATAEGDELQQKMAAYYEPVKLPELKPAAPQTPLPLALEKAANWTQAQHAVPDAARANLKERAFAICDSIRSDRVEQFYETLKNRGLPIFVTSDSLLHLYHIQFDETLRRIEEARFYDDLLHMTRALEAEGRRLYDTSEGIRKEAARLCWAYFVVAGNLLDPPGRSPEPIAADVSAEMALIEKHAGFAPSPLFKYKEDYSQYVPRGHYTRTDRLKRYFKAMMWYGRMAFLIKGRTPQIGDALITDEEARIQTLAALTIADALRRIKPEARGDFTCEQIWNSIYTVTAFYVGFADDLTPQEYQRARASIGMPKELASLQGDIWRAFQRAIAQLRSPEIYGGTGDVAGPPLNIATETDLDKALEKTKGMRFMGQRYIPDSYIMGRLVYPTIGRFTGQGTPFTFVPEIGGRGFPRGLDVMAVLGSDRARQILRDRGDDAYERFDETLAKLREKFGAISEKDWNRNAYWAWLNCLRALFSPAPDGYPTFMRSTAWQDKQLNAALGSWAQLRHDTILYAKQSYTMRLTAVIPPEPKMVEGYVEPVPELYGRLLALTRMTIRALDDMKVLDDQGRARLNALEGILARLLEISARELRNERLGPGEYEFIRSFGEQLKAAVAGVDTQGLETTIIADVHTDTNSGMVLEEATGYLRTIVVAYPMPDGGTVLGFGPVFSYYEFKHPMGDRLTDEAWKRLLMSPGAPQPFAF